MGYKRCIDCGEEFYADEHWKIRCVDCWREWKIGDGHSTRRTQQARLTEWGIRLARWESDLAAREARLEQQKKAVSPEWGSMLTKLIMLTHPDKHGGSQLSKTVTQWLLSQR